MNKKIRNLLVAVSGLALSVGAAVGVGLNSQKDANVAEAATGYKTFYVYLPGNVADYYNHNDSYNWLAGNTDGVAVHLWNSSTSSSVTSWPGTVLYRLGNGVLGIKINDTVDANRMNIVNVYTDNLSYDRTRAAGTKDWNDQYLDFDISSYNMYTLNYWNSPTNGAGAWDKNYSWTLKIADAGESEDSDAALTYNGTTQFENNKVTLTAGTTFTIEDSLGNSLINGETGAGSAFTKGFIEYDDVNDVFEVIKGGDYEVFAKPGDDLVWMQIDHTSEAEAWAEDFVNNVGCSNTYNVKPSNWDRYAGNEGDYSWSANLTNGAKGLFVIAEASNDPSATYVQKAAFIHDMCVAKYDGCSVFMKYNDGSEHSRGAIKNETINVSSAEANNTLIVIIAASAVSLLAVGGYFFIKRKQD